ncbi:MAG: 5-dehydro-4-deoxy-D-glucuronate isomerase [Phycisphaeraceae bacterium]|nr:MAG: 5-dehydro-4-deoxy-D-glucuronate isomerase [Phycisphaeraceae bacterium]
MQIRYAIPPSDVPGATPAELRERFLVQHLFEPGKVSLTYSLEDRMVIGGVMPTSGAVELPCPPELASDYFAERREIGVLNVGGAGTVTVDGTGYDIPNLDMLYIGRGAKAVSFRSASGSEPAKFYLVSCPAHKEYPTTLAPRGKANRVDLGSDESANKRTIFQFIHEEGVKSCQLVMGFTELATGSVWNTMPAHTHLRRNEVYMYFDLPAQHAVFHFMGEPENTRHLVMRDGEAVISPSWSIHAGSGTSNYRFCWAMGGENQRFTDMDAVEMGRLR